MAVTRRVLRFMLTSRRDPTDFRNQAMRVGRKGRIRGATYEQLTGEKPPRWKGHFGKR